ncbi:MAG: Lrp/AsnC family transcriptional regulator, partial [Deltaproteobacteria bacterium]
MNDLNRDERAIVNRIQSDFPITSRPFATIAEELGLSEKRVIDILVH